jgi:glycosyltransferase involved in cell wall biosynthesis
VPTPELTPERPGVGGPEFHVGLNLLFLVPGETGGTETYARELIPELVAAAPDARFTAFINQEAASAAGGPWGDLIPAVTVPVRARNRLEWVRGEQQLLPRAAGRARVDLLHSLANTAPGWGPYARTVTIHDLLHRIAPEAHLGMLGLGMRVVVTLAARRSARVIVDAESTRKDLQQLLRLDAGTIDVVPLGMGARRGPAAAEAEVRRTLDARDRPLVLSVSAMRPHKNLSRLVEAVALIAPERRPLVILVGYPTPYEEELRRQIAALALANDIRVLGWVGGAMLEGLYAASSAFVFPSLYEGFGLPVLEAMARGLPVACSTAGALSEVAGDAALTFDPHSATQIAGAIQQILTGGAQVERLRAAGRERAARYTWAATAEGTLASYARSLRRTN